MPNADGIVIVCSDIVRRVECGKTFGSKFSVAADLAIDLVAPLYLVISNLRIIVMSNSA